MKTSKNKGFTLLEILLVIAAIGILASIVLVAINPNRQLAQARNLVRQADINTIQKALEQYLIDNGRYPTSVSTTPGYICNTGTEQNGVTTTNCNERVDLRELIPTYLAAIPKDSQSTGTNTGYIVATNPDNDKVSISSGSAEGKMIVINPLYSISENGLYGRRFVGYYNDNVSFFNTATRHGDTNLTVQINNFTNNADLYSWQWLGYFLPPVTGIYTFFTASDDASHLWLGDNAITGYTVANTLVNNGGLHGVQERSGSINLTAGQYYPIRIMFGENGGGDIMTVSFSGPGITKTTNGNGYYFGGRYFWANTIGSL